MTIRQILAIVEHRAPCENVIAVAVEMAAAFDATLVCLYVSTPSDGPRYGGGLGLEAVAQAALQRVSDEAAGFRRRFESLTARPGLRSEWRFAEGVPAEQALLHARYSDLVVIARCEPAPPPSCWPLRPDDVVMAAGRPVVVVPREGAMATVGRRILVAWNASREATRAVSDAMPLLAAAEAVEVVLVNPGAGREGPFGHGEEAGADIAAHLARHGVRAEVRVERTTGAVGEALRRRAGVFQADMIVSGAYGYSRFREIVLGGVTEDLLGRSSVPVLLSR